MRPPRVQRQQQTRKCRPPKCPFSTLYSEFFLKFELSRSFLGPSSFFRGEIAEICKLNFRAVARAGENGAKSPFVLNKQKYK